MRHLAKAFSVLVICAAALVAKADTLNFTLTGEGNIYLFSLPSNPIPHAAANGLLFDLINVPVAVDNQVGLYKLVFFNPDPSIGTFALYTTDDYVILGLDGPQLYTGAEEAPVFAPGTFSLGNPTTEAPYTLVISAADPPPVPEPSTLLLLTTGALVVGNTARRHLAGWKTVQ